MHVNLQFHGRESKWAIIFWVIFWVIFILGLLELTLILILVNGVSPRHGLTAYLGALLHPSTVIFRFM